jgi:hypothetical protein
MMTLMVADLLNQFEKSVFFPAIRVAECRQCP